ncbi:MAG: hypothetical protein QM802_13975 [Agriterribacter sp.]
MSFKQKIHARCLQLLNEKISALQQIIKDLTESAANEGKSTAGDKHETALAMLQIEQENTSRQLKTALDQKDILEKIDPAAKTIQVGAGSVIKTNNGYLFLSVPLGKIKVDDTTVIALSPQSPLGKNLAGLKPNSITEMNGVRYLIETVF